MIGAACLDVYEEGYSRETQKIQCKSIARDKCFTDEMESLTVWCGTSLPLLAEFAYRWFTVYFRGSLY